LPKNGAPPIYWCVGAKNFLVVAQYRCAAGFELAEAIRVAKSAGDYIEGCNITISMGDKLPLASGAGPR
jgi:hypothetical protein